MNTRPLGQYFGPQEHDRVPMKMYVARSLSAAQESAQLLGGSGFVDNIMHTLLKNTWLGKQWKLNVLNVRPWEGTFELCLLNQANENQDWFPDLRILSVSSNTEVIKFAERVVATHLLKEPFSMLHIGHKACPGEPRVNKHILFTSRNLQRASLHNHAPSPE